MRGSLVQGRARSLLLVAARLLGGLHFGAQRVDLPRDRGKARLLLLQLQALGMRVQLDQHVAGFDLRS